MLLEVIYLNIEKERLSLLPPITVWSKVTTGINTPAIPGCMCMNTKQVYTKSNYLSISTKEKGLKNINRASVTCSISIPVYFYLYVIYMFIYTISTIRVPEERSLKRGETDI